MDGILFRSNFIRVLFASAALLLIGACTPAPIETGVNDPIEKQNRSIHGVNRALDQALVRPTANAYGTVVPGPVRTAVGNFSSNLGLPGAVVNGLLQFRIADAGQNLMRFLVNTTFGFGGILDVAGADLPEVATDFGETLHVWGVGEGAYIELPVVGPSTSRHTVGRIVDIAMDPLGFVLEGTERDVALGLGIAARFGDRYRYSDFIDSILYESADSYAQAQQLYLQNRRFQLSRGQAIDYEDPYDELLGLE